jgi:hypothetical protein
VFSTYWRTLAIPFEDELGGLVKLFARAGGDVLRFRVPERDAWSGLAAR